LTTRSCYENGRKVQGCGGRSIQEVLCDCGVSATCGNAQVGGRPVRRSDRGQFWWNEFQREFRAQRARRSVGNLWRPEDDPDSFPGSAEHFPVVGRKTHGTLKARPGPIERLGFLVFMKFNKHIRLI